MNLEFDPAALKGLHQLGGQTLVEQMIRLFLENTPKRIATALEAVKTGNWLELERAAHSMKSSAAHLGVVGLQERAGQIEALAVRHETRDLLPLIQDVAAAFPSIRDHFQKHLSTGA